MLMMLAPANLLAGTKETKNSGFDWTPVINAIIQVESGGNPNAVDKSGKSCGIMQITPICVQECNRILKMRKSQKRYTHKDRFSVEKSKEMFLLLQSFLKMIILSFIRSSLQADFHQYFSVKVFPLVIAVFCSHVLVK